MSEQDKFWQLVHPGSVKGLVYVEPKFREQDKEAAPLECYGVVFFPKITGIGDARVGFFHFSSTLSQTPEAAIAKFIDGVGGGREAWATYHDAGHRVRKLRIVDLGDAESGNPEDRPADIGAPLFADSAPYAE
jgi:hypothetical protein